MDGFPPPLWGGCRTVAGPVAFATG